MKFVYVIILGISSMLFACQSNQQSNSRGDSTHVIEKGPGKIVDEHSLVVPGRSIGEISIGEDMQKVSSILGKPDAGDAAMGKAWGIWHQKDAVEGNEFAVYSSYRDTSMTVKDVKQIRITSNTYKTQDGFTTGRSLSDTKLKFPGMEQVSTYLNENKDTVSVYDAKADGIGFEFLRGKSVALTVHQANVSVNNTYLTLHPEWKILN